MLISGLMKDPDGSGSKNLALHLHTVPVSKDCTVITDQNGLWTCELHLRGGEKYEIYVEYTDDQGKTHTES